MGTDELNAGGNSAMDYHPIQGGVEILPVVHATETEINSGLMGHLARIQTLPYVTYQTGKQNTREFCSIRY